jgi:hypothetical protein
MGKRKRNRSRFFATPAGTRANGADPEQ